jgi:putative ubiquitin-RnfH superfamily antitoxin RatB of RatAB toxin-antitoxin module
VTREPDNGLIDIEVVLAKTDRQVLLGLEVATGATIADAIRQSGILEQFEGFELDPANVGIFGRKADMETVLRSGDRVEIYHPLIADPKEARRLRALEQAKK